MDQRSRRRRVEGIRELLFDCAEREGVSATALLGLLLYFDNWSGGERTLASIGWKIFKGEEVKAVQSASLEESTWMSSK